MTFEIRIAALSDVGGIEALIKESARKLGLSDYSPAQIEAALKGAWGVDTQLIADQTYFVVEFENTLVGCGGWSYRSTLFGNDSEPNRTSDRLDPKTGAARIRAFFVKPEFARKGIGSMIMLRCEREARLHGFTRLELMATLPGKPLYERHGFVALTPIAYPLDDQLTIEFVRMTKIARTNQD
jgi:GNAT superfamily N-acetyltransferase